MDGEPEYEVGGVLKVFWGWGSWLASSRGRGGGAMAESAGDETSRRMYMEARMTQLLLAGHKMGPFEGRMWMVGWFGC